MKQSIEEFFTLLGEICRYVNGKCNDTLRVYGSASKQSSLPYDVVFTITIFLPEEKDENGICENLFFYNSIEDERTTEQLREEIMNKLRLYIKQ